MTNAQTQRPKDKGKNWRGLRTPVNKAKLTYDRTSFLACDAFSFLTCLTCSLRICSLSRIQVNMLGLGLGLG